jgi:hypothetical protein
MAGQRRHRDDHRERVNGLLYVIEQLGNALALANQRIGELEAELARLVEEQAEPGE